MVLQFQIQRIKSSIQFDLRKKRCKAKAFKSDHEFIDSKHVWPMSYLTAFLIPILLDITTPKIYWYRHQRLFSTPESEKLMSRLLVADIGSWNASDVCLENFRCFYPSVKNVFLFSNYNLCAYKTTAYLSLISSFWKLFCYILLFIFCKCRKRI